jgi:hypothetical protein
VILDLSGSVCLEDDRAASFVVCQCRGVGWLAVDERQKHLENPQVKVEEY